jgi:dihydropyrimidine dehydrogenase (NAD+) subunit PreA
MLQGFNLSNTIAAGLGNLDLISVHNIDTVCERVKVLKKEFPTKVVMASIMGSNEHEWTSLASELSLAGADIIECSFSCPQGSLGEQPGRMIAQSAAATETVTGWVKKGAKHTPVMIKITPMVADVVEIASAAKKAGADAVTASNTIPSLMGIDLNTFIPFPDIRGRSYYCGLSGSVIKPITLKVISEIARNVKIPVSGTGGASDWRDCAEFLLCGASWVQMATAVMYHGFRIIEDLKTGILYYLEEKGINNVTDLVGKALPNIADNYDELSRFKPKSKIDNERCIQCEVCFVACRDAGHGAISMNSERFPVVNEDLCAGCALCKVVCPVNGCVDIS